MVGHDALALFKSLPTYAKADLELAYRDLVDRTPTGPTMPFLPDFKAALHPFRNALQLWRYPYEQGTMARLTGQQQVGYMAGLLREYCAAKIGFERERASPFEVVGRASGWAFPFVLGADPG
jgi:hypothetical protein